MMQVYSIINGEFVLQENASLRVTDLALQRGYGIFDFFLTRKHQPLFLNDHLDRLFASAEQMRLAAGLYRDQLETMLSRLIAKNHLPDSGIRITLTGGYSEDGYTLSQPNLVITQQPFSFDQNAFQTGTSLVTHCYQRQLPEVKSIDYLQAIYLRPFVQSSGADEVLYFGAEGITECPRANFFIVDQNHEIVTTPSNVLKGITRKRILQTEIPVRERRIELTELSGIREAFISSTTKQLIPVLKINGHPVGDGQPGRHSLSIYQKLLQFWHQ